MEQSDSALIDELYEKNIKNENIQNLLRNEGILLNLIEENVRNDINRISFSRHLRRNKSAKNELKKGERKINERIQINKDKLKIGRAIISKSITAWLVALYSFLLVYLIIDYFFIHLKIFESIDSPYNLTFLITIAIVMVSLRIIAVFILNRKLQQIEALRKSEENKIGIPQLKKQIREDYENIQQLFSEELQLIVTENINKYNESINVNILDKYIAKNLSETNELDDKVPTQDFDRINDLINKMPGGCIGLSGKRGIGKSTMLLMLEDELEKREGEKSLLYLYTTAPINYNIRDFILFIFHSLGLKYLKRKGKEELYYESREPSNSNTKSSKLMSKPEVRVLAYLLYFIGGLFVLLAIYMPPTDKNGQLLFRQKEYPTPIKSDTLYSESLKNLTNQSSEKANDTINGTSIFNDRSSQDLYRFLNKVGLSSKIMFPTGIIFLIVSMFYIYFQFKINRHKKRLKRLKDEESAIENTTVYEIRKWLKRIKFQQSFSSGWSGGLNLPIGLKGNIEYAEQISHNQLSLPEVIDGFRNFINMVSKDFQVIICIDELDKLNTKSMDHNFLNEIKAIFGLRECFFLISVSEDAVSSFERRGIPFRDTFDSSFDDIIHIDYLDFNYSKKIINQRIIGFPSLFVLLAHSISVGVPRDLIRTTRKITEIHIELGSSTDFISIAKLFFNNEVNTRINAFKICLSNINDYKLTSKLYLTLSMLANHKVIEISHLKTSLESLVTIISECNSIDNNSVFSRILIEIHSYLLYVTVIYFYFTDRRKRFNSRTMVKHIINIENIVRAKQLFQYNPMVSRKIINDFIQIHSINLNIHLE